MSSLTRSSAALPVLNRTQRPARSGFFTPLVFMKQLGARQVKTGQGMIHDSVKLVAAYDFFRLPRTVDVAMDEARQAKAKVSFR